MQTDKSVFVSYHLLQYPLITLSTTHTWPLWLRKVSWNKNLWLDQKSKGKTILFPPWYWVWKRRSSILTLPCIRCERRKVEQVGHVQFTHQIICMHLVSMWWSHVIKPTWGGFLWQKPSSSVWICWQYSSMSERMTWSPSRELPLNIILCFKCISLW